MELLLAASIIVLGGLVKGLNGFGYALVSTPLLAVFMPAQEAVALMIIPLIACNLELAAETDTEELKNCLDSFSSFLIFLTAGVTIGMLAISLIPSRALEVSVGLLALSFATSRIPALEPHFGKIRSFCFRAWEPVIGFFSGIVYGASNVGVLIVAYLKSRDLGRDKFVGVLAVAILGISVYRILLAHVTGIYTGTDMIVLSLILGLPALLSVKIGEMLSQRLPETLLERSSVLLIAAIGAKLLLPF
ncbi:MAG: sulfite exporter TauE/SafE family protein [Candidatus Nanosalina sp.]